MKYSSLLVSALLVGSIGLMTGCDKAQEAVETVKKEADNATAAVKSASNKASTTEDPASVKIDAYIKGFNRVTRLDNSYERFKSYTLKRKATDNISFSDDSSTIGNAVESFKKGLDVQAAGMDDIDQAVKAFVEAAEKLAAQQKELKPYFESKQYQDDNLAKGKAAFPVLQADYESTLAALKNLSGLIGKYQRIESEKRIVKFKEQGDMVRFHTEEAMLSAQDLMALFENPEKAIKTPETYTKGDAVLVKLEAALDAQRKAYDEAKAKETKNISYYDSVVRDLTSMVGNYRELRNKKSPNAYNRMMREYNDAVDNYNRAGQFNRF